MARKLWNPANWLRQAAFAVLGALLTGFFTVAFAKLLTGYVRAHFAAVLGVGLAVSLTLWISQWLKHPPFLLKGASPLIAGFCAALGVHISRVWLA